VVNLLFCMFCSDLESGFSPPWSRLLHVLILSFLLGWIASIYVKCISFSLHAT
jgi:hypothetical protein